MENKTIDNFYILSFNYKNLSLDEQKKMFVAMLDNNQMYVNKTEMADKTQFRTIETDEEELNTKIRKHRLKIIKII